MKIVVIGGRGLVGTKLVSTLRAHGHEAISASPSSGVDAVTGDGLADALAGAQVLIDVADAPVIDGSAVIDFFVTSSQNLLAAGAAADIRHHIALSVVGVDHVRDIAYFRAKAAQEDLIRASAIPYTIVRSTQFFDFMERIVQASVDGDAIRISPALIQPVAPDDVADLLAEIAMGSPLNDTIELAGSEAIGLDELTRLVLSGHEDPRRVISDPHARFFGAALDTQSLMPGPKTLIGQSTVRDWLRHFITAD